MMLACVVNRQGMEVGTCHPPSGPTPPPQTQPLLPHPAGVTCLPLTNRTPSSLLLVCPGPELRWHHRQMRVAMVVGHRQQL